MILATGTFLLSATYARSPGNGLGEDTREPVLPCRVRNCTGIVNDSVLDVIKHINNSVLGTEYNASNYDTVAWEAAEAALPCRHCVRQATEGLRGHSNLAEWR